MNQNLITIHLYNVMYFCYEIHINLQTCINVFGLATAAVYIASNFQGASGFSNI